MKTIIINVTVLGMERERERGKINKHQHFSSLKTTLRKKHSTMPFYKIIITIFILYFAHNYGAFHTVVKVVEQCLRTQLKTMLKYEYYYYYYYINMLYAGWVERLFLIFRWSKLVSLLRSCTRENFRKINLGKMEERKINNRT